MGVLMRHPDSGGTYDAQPSQVPHLQESGWQVAEGQTEQGEVWPAEVRRFEGQPPVRMRHPQVADEITVAESARPHHAAQGWLVVEDAVEEAGVGSWIQEVAFEDYTVEQLRDEARAVGVMVSGTKAELIERLRAMQQAPAEAGQSTKEA